MRFNSIKGRGWIGLPEPFDIPLDKLEGKIIGLVGPIGAGKTSFVELLLGALYRTMPTRGNLVNFARDRDAVVEVGITNGSDYTFRQLVDGEAKKVEAVVFNGSGVPLIQSAKIHEYRSWVGEHLPAPSVLLASIFAAQRQAGFIDLTRAERMSVLLRILGIERYEKMASTFGKRAQTVSGQLTLNEARLSDYGALAAITSEEAIGLASAELEAAASTFATTETALLEVRKKAEEQTTLVAAIRETITENTRMREAITSARTRVAELESRRTDLQDRIKTFKATLDSEKAIGQAKTHSAELTAEIARVEKEITALEASKTNEVAEAGRGAKRLAEIDQSVKAATKRLDGAVKKQEARQQAEADKSSLPAAQLALSQAEAESAAAIAAKEALVEERFEGDAGRITRLRGNLETIATDETVEPRPYAGQAHSLDTDQEVAQAKRPELLKAASDRVTTAGRAEKQARDKVEVLEKSAALLKEMLDAEELEKVERAALSAYAEEKATLGKSLTKLAKSTERAAKSIRTKEAEKTVLKDTLEKLGDVEARATELLTAKASVGELEREVTETETKLKAAARTVRALPEPPEDPAIPDDAELTATVKTAEEAFLEARLSHSMKQTALSEVTQKCASLDILRQAIVKQKEEQSQWQRLANDFGRNGLQAMEIQAAGPQLTDKINTLLHNCFGTRWTVTVKVGAEDGKVTEECTIIVYDAEKGIEQEANTLSGGEHAIVGEACSLGLTELACKRAGVIGPTLIRDESGDALDHRFADHATQYIAMLRQAAAEIGASKVLLVSHGPELALADSWLRFTKGGGIRICNNWEEAIAA